MTPALRAVGLSGLPVRAATCRAAGGAAQKPSNWRRSPVGATAWRGRGIARALAGHAPAGLVQRGGGFRGFSTGGAASQQAKKKDEQVRLVMRFRLID